MFLIQYLYHNRVKSFDLFDDCLAIVDFSDVLVVTNQNNVIFSKNVEECRLVQFVSKTLLSLIKSDGRGLFISITDNDDLNFILEGDAVLFLDIKSGIFYSQKWISFDPIDVEYSFVNLNSRKILWSKRGGSAYSFMGYGIAVSIQSKIVTIQNELTGDTLFEIDLSHYLGTHASFMNQNVSTEIRRIIGVYNHILWVALNSGETIGINLNRGKLAYLIGFKESKLTSFPFEVKPGDYLPFGDKVQLDEDRGEILGLRDKYFIYSDLKQNQISREYIDVGHSMSLHNIESSYRNNVFPIDENYIYFCDDRRGKIGVFDRHKREVVWSYELEMERSGIAQILEMKYANDRWYILDRNDTLHVFERIKINETNQQTKP